MRKRPRVSLARRLVCLGMAGENPAWRFAERRRGDAAARHKGGIRQRPPTCVQKLRIDPRVSRFSLSELALELSIHATGVAAATRNRMPHAFSNLNFRPLDYTPFFFLSSSGIHTGGGDRNLHLLQLGKMIPAFFCHLFHFREVHYPDINQYKAIFRSELFIFSYAGGYWSVPWIRKELLFEIY